MCVCVLHSPDWVRPVHNNTTQHQHCTAALEGLQASMDGGQYKLCGDQRIPNQGEQSRMRGRGRTFLLQDNTVVKKLISCEFFNYLT